MNNDNEKMVKEKLDFFWKEKVKVHISKHNKEFLNGFIVGQKDDSIYIIEDSKLGELVVFVSEIFDVNEYRREL